jgi:hypothetical protein
MVLVLFLMILDGCASATTYLDTRNFTEPMFVFAVRDIAGTPRDARGDDSDRRDSGPSWRLGVLGRGY